MIWPGPASGRTKAHNGLFLRKKKLSGMIDTSSMLDELYWISSTSSSSSSTGLSSSKPLHIWWSQHWDYWSQAPQRVGLDMDLDHFTDIHRTIHENDYNLWSGSLKDSDSWLFPCRYPHGFSQITNKPLVFLSKFRDSDSCALLSSLTEGASDLALFSPFLQSNELAVNITKTKLSASNLLSITGRSLRDV